MERDSASTQPPVSHLRPWEGPHVRSPCQLSRCSHIGENRGAQHNLVEGVWLLRGVQGTPLSPCTLLGDEEAELLGTGPSRSLGERRDGPRAEEVGQKLRRVCGVNRRKSGPSQPERDRSVCHSGSRGQQRDQEDTQTQWSSSMRQSQPAAPR